MNKLSRRCLRAIRRAYKSNGRIRFSMEFFTAACPNEDSNRLSVALSALAASGVVENQYADDIAFETTYLPEADQAARLGRVKGALKWIAERLPLPFQ